MAKYTDYLNLFKWDPDIDGEEEFDIEKALNENWDKLDVKIKQHILDTAQTILNFETKVNKDFADEKEDLEKDFSDYKERIEEDFSEYKKTIEEEMNIFATTEMVNDYISDSYDATKTYEVDDYCIYNNTLYKCTTAITTAEEFDNTKWSEISIMKAIDSAGGNEITIGEETDATNKTKLIIETDDILNNIGTEVVDTLEGNESNMSPSVRAVKEALTYSTDEVIIGTGINGGPRYRKFIEFGTLPNNAVKYVAHNISNICNVHIYGFTNDYYQIPFKNISNSNEISTWHNNNNVFVQTNFDGSSVTATLVMEYEKTTDEGSGT